MKVSRNLVVIASSVTEKKAELKWHTYAFNNYPKNLSEEGLHSVSVDISYRVAELTDLHTKFNTENARLGNPAVDYSDLSYACAQVLSKTTV